MGCCKSRLSKEAQFMAAYNRNDYRKLTELLVEAFANYDIILYSLRTFPGYHMATMHGRNIIFDFSFSGVVCEDLLRVLAKRYNGGAVLINLDPHYHNSNVRVLNLECVYRLVCEQVAMDELYRWCGIEVKSPLMWI